MENKCKVKDCKNPHHARGWCRLHYRRWKNHNDPLYCARYDRKEVLKYLKEHMFDGCCTPWPYRRRPDGYAALGKKYQLAHQIVCRIAKGPKPFPNAIVRHLCGKGHCGCFNAECLKWGTRKEDTQDKIRHGTLFIPNNKGEKNGMAIFTLKQVRRIKKALAKGYSPTEIAKVLKKNRSTIEAIKNGRSWTHVEV